ncbi:MAG: DUF3592 domain-containing protein [Methylomonas sp.]|jgi:hypothetical protein|uniref:DUF3592 domain-containing protein n=1 Tax=Methylomonas sp. TaxID=418 RepID=UPI0025D69819|nr:DUF3592 domain-containing protein [Methylomonas sp.]MCK9605563.1 DUF3592 domain-containing protein [Methylomonas sp.]
MMIPNRDLTVIKAIKAALLLAMALLALSQVYFAVLKSRDNIEKLSNWTRQPAEIDNLGLTNEVEVITTSAFADAIPNKSLPKNCIARDEGTACLLLASDPYAWLSVFDQVDLLQNPRQPDQLAIASISGFWLPVAGNGLTLLLLAAIWHWIRRYSLWGEDVTFINGTWVATFSSQQHIGFGSMDAEPISESASNRKAVIFWLVIMVLIALTLMPAIQSEAAGDRYLLAYPTTALGMVFLALFTFAKTASRTIYQDRTGLVDSSFFGLKRIPWSVIADVKLVNLNQEAQRSYDRHHTFSDQRPDTLNVYQVLDRRGRSIMRLSEAMSPPHAFSALLSRMRQQSRAEDSVPAKEETARFRQDNAAEQHKDHTDFEAHAMRMMGLKMPPRKSLFHRDHRSTLIGLALLLAPFVLLTGYLAYKSIWFQVAAERTAGRVVEIKQDELPSLVVEYRTPQGNTLFLNSDGSGAYAGYRVGDTLTVFYDAGEPENARLDLFLELWLGTILMGVLTGLVLLAVVLIGRSLTTPMPMSMK